MLINSRQAGSILGCHYGSIKTMVQKGTLKDYGTSGHGKTRHLLQLDMAEVKELAKLNRQIQPPPPRLPLAPSMPAPSGMFHTLNELGNMLQALNAKISDIDDKVTRLLAAWEG